MGRLELRQLDSVHQLRAVAPAWDALWQRSETTFPTARAELVAQWLEHFAPRARLRILLVREADELVAALPLVGRRLRAVLPVGDLTMNYWSPNGELLLDPTADQEPVLDILADALVELPWPLVWLEMVPIETSRWHNLAEAIRRCGSSVDVHRRYRIGQVAVDGRFESYQASRSKNLLRNLRKDLRRLEKTGRVELEVQTEFAPGQVDDRLFQAFDLEDRSWKASGGHSVLRTPGMFDFYCRQARQLARWGHLQVAFLKRNDEPLAFELGWTAKEVYHSYKVGYDEAYRHYGPGHLLRMHLIRWLYEQPGYRLVDSQGPMTEALARWATQSYPIGRIVVAPRRLKGQALMAGYRTLAPLVRCLRRIGHPQAAVTLHS